MSSSSSEEIEEEKKKEALIRQISESISNYSIEAANEKAGVTSPAKVQSPSKLSITSTEQAKPKASRKKLPLLAKKQQQKPVLEIPKATFDSLSSDADEPPAKPKSAVKAPPEDEDDEFSRFLKAQPQKLRKSSTGETLAAKKSDSYPNLFG